VQREVQPIEERGFVPVDPLGNQAGGAFRAVRCHHSFRVQLIGDEERQPDCEQQFEGFDGTNLDMAFCSGKIVAIYEGDKRELSQTGSTAEAHVRQSALYRLSGFDPVVRRPGEKSPRGTT
jgi:hypothetical protein